MGTFPDPSSLRVTATRTSSVALTWPLIKMSRAEAGVQAGIGRQRGPSLRSGADETHLLFRGGRSLYSAVEPPDQAGGVREQRGGRDMTKRMLGMAAGIAA